MKLLSKHRFNSLVLFGSGPIFAPLQSLRLPALLESGNAGGGLLAGGFFGIGHGLVLLDKTAHSIGGLLDLCRCYVLDVYVSPSAAALTPSALKVDDNQVSIFKAQTSNAAVVFEFASRFAELSWDSSHVDSPVGLLGRRVVRRCGYITAPLPVTQALFNNIDYIAQGSKGREAARAMAGRL